MKTKLERRWGAVAAVALAPLLLLALSGCGMLGCGGAATNGMRLAGARRIRRFEGA